MDICLLAGLSDAELLARAKRLAHDERRATAALVAHLAEIESRKLYLGQACASLFVYCTRVLHLSEHAAYNRIEAARAARQFPAILAGLEQGRVHLTAVRLLAPVLTDENHHDVLAQASYKSKREVEELVARLRPRPDVPTHVRKLPGSKPPGAVDNPVANSTSTPPAVPVAVAPGVVSDLGLRAAPVPATKPRAVVVPLAPERYKVQFTASAATRDRLRRAQELLRHRIPDGDVAQVIDLALGLLVQDLEKKKFAATARPASGTERTKNVRRPATTPPVPTPASPPQAQLPPAQAQLPLARAQISPAQAQLSPARAQLQSSPARAQSSPLQSQASPSSRRSRYISAAVKRAVWERDQGRCGFVSSSGDHCDERGGLEFDHIKPYADGGGSTVDNVRLLCKRHNRYEAQQFYGLWQADAVPQAVRQGH